MATNSLKSSVRVSALAAALSMCFAGTVSAQSTVGSIYGNAKAGDTITIQSIETGASRQVVAGSDGRYTFNMVTPGRYKVIDNGVTQEVEVKVNTGSSANFVEASGKSGAELGTVTVVGTSYNANAIDVTKVDSSTVFTASELKNIAVARSVASVALLAPSVVANTSYSANAPSFGGSASSENAYYINGYAVTNPLSSIGFSQLPFDAADQIEVMTGGYGPQYGRSTGGVISVNSKRGSNQWHFGAGVFYTPSSMRSDFRDVYYPSTGFYGAGNATKIETDGKLYLRRAQNEQQTLQYGVYASGPIVKDHLFFYVNADLTKTTRSGVSSAANQNLYSTNPATVAAVVPGLNSYYENSDKYPRWLAKLDWNINSNHTLEFTGVQDIDQYRISYGKYNYKTLSQTSDPVALNGTNKDGGRLYIAKYTGHFGENFSVSALLGQQNIKHEYTLVGYDPSCPRLSGSTSNIKPGLTGSLGCQTQAKENDPNAFDRTHGGRLDLNWTLGKHSLQLGYDRSIAHTESGTNYAGGFVWVYSTTANYNTAINAGLGVGAPGAAAGTPTTGTQGWYVRRQYYGNSANVETNQYAYYLEDKWQITDRFLLSLGIRNENFINYNGAHKPYVQQKNQWAPRIGFSWDVAGDSSLKVFGNIGRYHLALPNNVAARAASNSTYTVEYFNYTGIDPKTGAPTGLTNIPVTNVGYNCPGSTTVVSSNLECGNARDPRLVAAVGLKPHYQDEFVLGFQHQLTPTVNWGLKYHYRSLRNAIDDTCTTVLGGECFIFNPGIGNTFYEDDGTGNLTKVYYSAQQLNLPKVKRKYSALDAYVEHSLANNWYGRLEYSFSKNTGNTEGQLASDLDTAVNGGGGQADVSTTQDWDKPALMEGAYGYLPNHRAHQLKAYGFYSFTPEWRVGGSAIITSGRPLSCTSFYPNPNADAYTGSYYHWCGLPGTPGYVYTPRGSSGFTPWTHQYNFNVSYVPKWAGKKLTFAIDVLNAFNEQNPQFRNMNYATDRSTVNRLYGQDLSYEAPRSFRFSIRYDY